MTPHANAAPLVDLFRGGRLESQHRGHAVVADLNGITHQWGDPETIVFPRSAIKMLQSLPLVASGAADHLSQKHLALACASHNGAAIHTQMVSQWLAEMGLSDNDLICGPQAPRDKDAKFDMIRGHAEPCRVHNNCSGKHAGFLTLAQHLKAGANYTDLDHPVQKHVFETYAEITDADIHGHGIDGCSAPNPASTLASIARAMAWYATAHQRSDVLSASAVKLRDAMKAYPEYVAGEGRACTALMRAMNSTVVKTGAEGVFIAIVPDLGLGVALKIADGTTRAAEAAVAHILTGLGRLEPGAQTYINTPIRNWDGHETGHIRPAEGFSL